MKRSMLDTMAALGAAARSAATPSLIAILTLLPALARTLAAEPALEAGFVSPPSEYRPQGWFFWVDGNVTKDGLTKDLESMKAAGLGGGVIFDIGGGPRGPVEFFGKEWRGLMQHTFQEADRLDLQFGMHNCRGWGASAGPWVTVEDSHKMLGWTETLADGPGRVNDPLPKIPITDDYYREVAVLAYPEAEGGGDMLCRYRSAAKVTADGKALDLGALIDRNFATKVEPKGSKVIQVDLPRDATICSALIATPGAGGKGGKITMSAKNQDGQFLPVTEFQISGFSRMAARSANFAPITARSFRFECGEAWNMPVGELGLGTSPLIADASAKAGFDSSHNYDITAEPAGLPAIAKPEQVIDLTDKLRPDGTLDWDVPAGTWTILRFGMTTTGGKNMQCDKLDAAAMRHHLESYLGVIVKEAGPLAGKSFRYAEIDSYEQAPSPNWTGKMPEKFRTSRGYDIGPWMVALAGRALGSIEETERFLWDFRRTVADVFAHEFYGTLRKFLNERGMLAYAEGYGAFMGDVSQCSGQVDVPMTEFWWHEPVEGKPRSGGQGSYVPGASAANTYGRNIVAAEAFSTLPPEAGWRNHPRAMKAQGDSMFLNGVNQFIFHAHPHQAYDVAPGITPSVWGSQFGRHVSWWPLSRGWHDYVSRCQYLLRQGRSQSDIAQLMEEEIPERFNAPPPAGLSAGYRFDKINTEVVLENMTARDGKLVLPCGAEYRVLVTTSGRMRIEMARKLVALVEAGGVVVGPKPEHVLGLNEWRKNEAELKRLADGVWGDKPGEHAYGKGCVFWPSPTAVADALKKAGALPDCTGLPYLHRTAPGFDAYFLANNSSKPEEADCVFRVTGRQPELWDPMTGEMTRPRGVKQTDDGRTSARVSLPVDGSIFVVFRENGPAELPDALDPAALKPVAEVTSPWQVAFEPNRGAPASAKFDKLISWPEHPDAGIKYFSGVATYRTTLDLPAVGKGQRLFLDLGKVADVARVKLNGTMVGYAWAEPLRVEITNAAKRGENTLEIEVANRWINRLIGDEQYPDDAKWTRNAGFGATGFSLAEWPAWLSDPSKRGEPRRVTLPHYKHYTKDSPLVPAGLLGPVRLETVGGTRENR